MAEAFAEQEKVTFRVFRDAIEAEAWDYYRGQRDALCQANRSRTTSLASTPRPLKGGWGATFATSSGTRRPLEG